MISPNIVGFFSSFNDFFFPVSFCGFIPHFYILNHSLCGFVTFLTCTNIYFPFLNRNVATWVFIPSSILMELLPVWVPANCPLLVCLNCFRVCGVLFWTPFFAVNYVTSAVLQQILASSTSYTVVSKPFWQNDAFNNFSIILFLVVISWSCK